MAITKSAKKRIKSSEKKRIFNLRRTRVMKDVIKKFTKAVESGDIKSAEEMTPTMYKAIDKAVKGGVIKQNTAARTKSRLTKRVTKAKA
jgi:small subunit ribosomal protein S20